MMSTGPAILLAQWNDRCRCVQSRGHQRHEAKACPSTKSHLKLGRTWGYPSGRFEWMQIHSIEGTVTKAGTTGLVPQQWHNLDLSESFLGSKSMSGERLFHQKQTEPGQALNRQYPVVMAHSYRVSPRIAAFILALPAKMQQNHSPSLLESMF